MRMLWSESGDKIQGNEILVKLGFRTGPHASRADTSCELSFPVCEGGNQGVSQRLRRGAGEEKNKREQGLLSINEQALSAAILLWLWQGDRGEPQCSSTPTSI